MLLKVLMLHVTHNGRVGLLSEPAELYFGHKKKKKNLTQTAALLNAGLRHMCERGCYQAALRLLRLSAPHCFINQFVHCICAFNTRSSGDSCSCITKLCHRDLALLLQPLFISKIYCLMLS